MYNIFLKISYIIPLILKFECYYIHYKERFYVLFSRLTFYRHLSKVIFLGLFVIALLNVSYTTKLNLNFTTESGFFKRFIECRL